MEYDIWGDSNGHICALPACMPFVDDADAPYGYDRHLIRICSSNRRDAIRAYHAAK